MEPVEIVSGTALPLRRSDVDTDQIIPSDWLKRVERTGFDRGLFSEWRDDPSFILNDERFGEAIILIAGPNFGTGSSREHAAWAIQQYGFDAVVSPSFGPIFKINCTKNGLVPVEVSAEVGEALIEAVENNPDLVITIDVANLKIEAPEADISSSFELEVSTQERFLKGLDDISLTLLHENKIEKHQMNRPSWLPSVTA
tara:strand:- start:541 stop:1137 length:597 start_codon:yes stop_codon:yes gene_type:complete